MNRTDLVQQVRSLAADSQIDLHERAEATPRGTFFAARIVVNTANGVLAGSGVFHDRQTTVDKALCEILERHAFLASDPKAEDFRPAFPVARLLRAQSLSLGGLDNLGKSSVGCAVHLSAGAARKNAILELTERHTLLVAQLTRCPGSPSGSFSFESTFGPVDFHQFAWLGPLDTFCTLTEVLDRRDGRVLFSSGAGSTMKEAGDKAFEEAISLLDNFASPMTTSLPIDSCKTIADLKLWHAGNPEGEPFYRRPPAPSLPPRIDHDLSKSDFWVAQRRLDNGLFFCRAYSPLTQNLFVGSWTREQTHPRLRHHWSDGIAPPYAY